MKTDGKHHSIPNLFGTSNDAWVSQNKSQVKNPLAFIHQVVSFDVLSKETHLLNSTPLALKMRPQDSSEMSIQKAPSRSHFVHDMSSWQVSRLQNRVLLLQRELEMLRGPRGRGAHMEPMVPEKQFQQLTTAHAKVGCGMWDGGVEGPISWFLESIVSLF